MTRRGDPPTTPRENVPHAANPPHAPAPVAAHASVTNFHPTPHVSYNTHHGVMQADAATQTGHGSFHFLEYGSFYY